MTTVTNKMYKSKIVVVVLFCLLTSCSTLKSTDDLNSQISRDPLEGFNRGVYAFNTTADKVILKPIAKGYNTVVPKPAKNGVRNFFNNLNEPLNVVNNLLQGQIERSLIAVARFALNSTFGFAGLFDIAKHSNLAPVQEDFGQTLAAWGVKPGPYLMLPFLGPTNLRDSFGRIADASAYYPINELTETDNSRVAFSTLDLVDTRSNLLKFDDALNAQLDPYSFIKLTIEQNRINALYNGTPPENDNADEF